MEGKTKDLEAEDETTILGEVVEGFAPEVKFKEDNRLFRENTFDLTT